MSVIFASPVAAWIFFVAGVVLIVAALVLFSDRDTIIGGIVAMVCWVFVAYAFAWSSTHRVVPANNVAILINRSTGQTSGGVRQAGISGEN